ncbi:hypothetical protein FVE85_3999 [Porphyridium purpureum]|uniref:Uncharacterized protein n=1 Tax=Porphyridium purpureum TaxID=35688 RepID=A0A5J4YTJ5_PORPP|nr:hypothetical protein FVE85_3999 [Porphyridium purpureum]|eukprot:POR8826..scf229_5
MNSLALERVQSWTTEYANHESQYFYRVLDPDFTHIEAILSHESGKLLDDLSEEERKQVRDLAEERVLHDAYGLPWDVINELESSRTDILSALQVINSAMNSRWGHGFGLIFAEVSGSAFERMLGLASALGLAVQMHRPVIISWGPVSGTGKAGVAQRLGLYFEESLVDGANVGDEQDRAHMFSIKQWKCQTDVETCMDWDKAYGRIAEYRTGNDEDIIANLLDGKIVGKSHLLLRLSGSLARVPKQLKIRALSQLIPSGKMIELVQSMREKTTGSLGIFLGAGMKPKAIKAVASRVEKITKPQNLGVFIIGSNTDDVRMLRQLLSDYSVAKAEELDEPSRVNESAEQALTRSLAEIYALGLFCKDIINDGKVPATVLELTDLLRGVKLLNRV